jgi:hypothetical protein
MQRQAHLLELGRARLALFETFCFPSMVHQTSQNFLWLICTDPDLPKDLYTRLSDLVSPYPNIFLIETNKNNLTLTSPDFNETMVAIGDTNLLMKAKNATEKKLLIETRLDADDGLHVRFVEQVQKVSVAHLSKSHENSWMIFCIDRHLEWFSRGGKWYPRGTLIPIRDTAECVTAGLTYAIAPNVSRPRAFRTRHDRLIKGTTRKVPLCKKISTGDACVYRLERELAPVAAVRSRTPTSAGMNKVLYGRNSTKITRDLPWTVLKSYFAVSEKRVKIAKEYLDNHLKEIAEENLKGQW